MPAITALSLQATIFDQTVGPFPGNTAKCAKLSNIIDGTSNTVAFSEIVKGVGAFANNLDKLTPSATPVPLTVAATGISQTDYSNCKVGVPRTVSANTGGFPFGACWWWGRSGQNRFTGVMPPNGFSCDFSANNSDSDDDAITAGSRHSGVANYPDDGRLGPHGEVHHQPEHLVGHHLHGRRRGGLGRRLLSGRPVPAPDPLRRPGPGRDAIHIRAAQSARCLSPAFERPIGRAAYPPRSRGDSDIGSRTAGPVLDVEVQGLTSRPAQRPSTSRR